MHKENILIPFLLFGCLFSSLHAQVYHYPWGEMHSKSELKEDLNLLKNTLYEYHIDLDYYSPLGEIDAAFKNIESSLIEEENTMSFFNKLTSLNPLIANVHTSFTLPDSLWKNFKSEAPLFPLAVYLEGERLFIVKNFSKNENANLGAQILKVNGKSTEMMMRHFQSTQKRDGLNSSYPRRRSYYSFALLYARTYGLCDSFRLELELPVGEPKVVVVAAVPDLGDKILNSPEYVQLYLPEYGNDTLPLELIVKSGVPILKVKSLQVAQYKKMGIKYDKWIKQAFKTIKRAGYDRLILDLRDNSGGQPEPGEELLTYLRNHPFRVHSEVTTKVAKIDLPHPFEDVEMYNYLKWKESGSLYTLDEKDWQRAKKISKCQFNGKLIVLINPFTSSAAGTFAGQLSSRANTIFIGEETGGNPYRTVAWYIMEMKLPHTKVMVKVPLVRSVKNVQLSDDEKQRGIQPDIELQPSVHDILNRVDPVLQRALSEAGVN